MKDHSTEISAILEIIESQQDFVLTTHINPDGDGLGSELALYYLLRDLGKNVHIINASPAPSIYRFLDPGNRLFHVYAEEHDELFAAADVIFVLDISVMHRLGAVAQPVEKSGSTRICIDHHSTNNCSSDFILMDEDAVATGELIYAVLKQGGCRITQQIAEALYVAIMTDTGCFRFSNTNAAAHAISAEMLRLGIDRQKVYNHIYESNSWAKTMLFARALGTLDRAYDGRVAWLTISRDLFKETGAQYQDTEGFVEYAREIKDVQISILFIERKNNIVKASFRSSNHVEVDMLAAEFGGGGHRNAAAAVIRNSSLSDAVERVMHAAGKYVH